MKKNLLYIAILLAGIVTGCKKDEDPIFADPDTRLTAALKEDQDLLTSAPNGWLANVYPAGGKGFSYYFKFSADGKVTMLSDFNVITATTPSESTYRLKALQRPTLIFDTYNYIHLPADPDPSASGGSQSTGLKSDFEFAFLSKNVGDTVKMEGTFNYLPVNFIKLGATEQQAILAGGLKTMTDANAAYLLANKNPYIQFPDNVKGAILIDPVAKTLKLNYLDAQDKSQLKTATFAYGINKLMLNTPITYGNITFKELYYDAAGKFYYVKTGATTQITLQNSATPIIPLRTLFVPGGSDYSQIEYNPATVAQNQSGDFNTRWNAAKAGLAAVGNAGRILDAVRVIINLDNTMTLRYYYRNTAGSSFQAAMTYSYTRDAAGVYSFTYLATDGNGGVVGSGLTALTDYFRSTNNTFKIDWVTNPSGGAAYGGLYTVSNPASFFYGTLIK